MKELDELVQESIKGFEKQFGSKPDVVAQAPGRINIIGEHTDYAGGLALPAAINRWMICCCSPNTDKTIRIYSEKYKEEYTYKLNLKPIMLNSWHQYVNGVIQVWNDKFFIDKGFTAFLSGNIPSGSGVSSSAALIVSLMNALKKLYKLKLSDLQLVKFSQGVENKYLNLDSGMMDQYASQFSQAGKYLLIDFSKMDHELIEALNDHHSWVVINSNIVRQLNKRAYSQRVRELKSAIKTALSSNLNLELPYYLSSKKISDTPSKLKRLRHFITENDRVLTAVDLIKNNKIEELGKLLNESHQSLRDDFEVSVPEIDFLADKANQFDGCYGARIMGGGFGGSVLCLLDENQFDKFSSFIKYYYKEEYDLDAEVFEVKTVGGAGVVTG
ncbi:MAG: galactokinase [Bacteroidetes bacterium]|nr:galactokinase [Bacteroidota bacterium]